ncbi:MAG: hypothetical protein FWF15_09095 [Oscillospiraceae bacterium]|nr:hypothetical protein [Oscillospiraceae bacterium]
MKYSLFSLILLITIFITACGTATDLGSSDTTSAPETVAGEETIKSRPALNLPDKNFEGYKFRVLACEKTTPGTPAQFLDFGWSPEMAGDLINDAVYTRNLMIEERYNIEIVNHTVAGASISAQVQKVILADSDEYDIVTPYMTDAMSIAQKNLLVDLYTVPYLDITTEWWDHALIRNLGIGKKIFFTTGDISMNDEELNYCIVFNKVLIDKFDLTDPYRLVEADNWNLDTITELGAAVTSDLNGDGVINGDDMVGIMTSYSVAPVWFFSLGGQIAVLNSDGRPEIIMNSAQNQARVERLGVFLRNEEAVFDVMKVGGNWGTFNEILMEDRGLFRIASVYNIQLYRQMLNDFGVLPYPKMNPEQDDYYHIIATQVCQGICVPVTSTDLSRTGIILEALAYESKDTVTKAYYEINLYTKVTRDEESAKMFDIIFSTKRYDLCKVFNWGGLEGILPNAVQNSNFASLYAAAETRANTEMEKSYEFFTE